MDDTTNNPVPIRPEDLWIPTQTDRDKLIIAINDFLLRHSAQIRNHDEVYFEFGATSEQLWLQPIREVRDDYFVSGWSVAEIGMRGTNDVKWGFVPRKSPR